MRHARPSVPLMRCQAAVPPVGRSADVLRGSIEQWTLEACHSAGFLDIETSDGMADFMEVVNLRDEARNLKG